MDGGVALGSESKKRGCGEFEEFLECGQKRAKPRDLESVFCSEGKTKEAIPPTLDLNAKSCDPPENDVENANKFGKSRPFGLDLNSDDVSSSISQDPFRPPHNTHKRSNPHDAFSECASTCGSQREKDPMRVWNEMKQNGFLSSSHGGVPVPLPPPPPSVPKPRGRKKGNESSIKKKIEIAKREQVDRFAKAAAPSGLLNELNPGIINHVRNRKQVHSIIENLVRSTRSENRRKGEVAKEGFDRKEVGNEGFDKNDVYNLELKLSSTATVGSMSMSSLTNDESANLSTVNSLSVKAASVASQWLELLHQDIKDRLAALRRSKKRVRAVIQTELPFLLSRELFSNQENEPLENFRVHEGTADLHRARWTALFDQMDKSLSEEEKHLESSLNQVGEMLLHCEHGLLQFHPENGLQPRATLQPDNRTPKAETDLDKELAVRAAAAAIFSTSNYLRSMENQPSF